MRPFVYERAPDAASAARSAAAGAKNDMPSVMAPGQFLAGGTTLLDLMKLDMMRPETLIDINGLDKQWSKIDVSAGGLRLGALARMSEVADNADIKKNYPLIAQSLQLAASQQLRNMATIGGNILQRTRCTYFRDIAYSNCNKRTPGSGCAAIDGVNRTHAVLGTSSNCIATYPGDFAQALMALDAQVEISGSTGSRTISFRDFHRQPGDTPHVETVLAPGELITAFTMQGGPKPRSLYLKVRDRESYEFALTSAAIVLDIQNGTINEARIALGGVATAPWRADAAEKILKGQAFNQALAERAAEAAFASARAFGQNNYKIALGKQTVVRALVQAAAMEI